MAEMNESKNFIHTFIDEDIAEGGRYAGQTVHTRFPPEPNGYLHIGHCKALIIDFGTAEKYNGLCNLRMDDTNPTKEDVEFVEAIKEDIRWLGFDWGDRFYYGSDYFEKDYEYAVELIKKGLAYVCELTPDQAKEMRGDLNTPATSPYRDRPIEESLDLFARMRAGEFEDNRYTLRAKLIWPPATSICVTRLFTVSVICTIIARVISGASILCMTLHTPSRMPWRVSPTLCVLWNLKTTDPCTTGLWKMFLFRTLPVRSSSPVWVSTTPYFPSVNSASWWKRAV